MEKSDISKRKFSILQEISHAIVFTDNISSIANLMLDLAISYTDAETGSLMLVNEREELYVLAARGLDQHFARTYRAKIGQGIAGTVAKNRRPVLVEDIDTDRNFRGKKRDHYKTRSFISCPVVNKDRLLGVLNINDKKDGSPFNEDEFELLKIIADQAAMALENAFLMTRLKTKAAELEEMNKKLIETDILKTKFFTRISHELRTPLNSIRGAIYVLQQTGSVPAKEREEFQGIISTEADKLTAIIEDLLSFLRLEDEARILNKTVLSIGDVLRELQGSPSLRQILTSKGIQLNITTRDSSSDIVADKIRTGQLFINLVDGLSHYLGRGDAIEISTQDGEELVLVNILLPRRMPKNVLPYLNDTKYVFHAEHTDDRLKLYLARGVAEVHQWRLTAENTQNACRITLAIPKNVKEKIEAYLTKGMDSFVDFISEALDLDICSIMLTDELTGELSVKSARGLDDEIIKRTRIKFGDKIAGWVALEGKPLYIENIENDHRFAKKSIPQYNTKSLMSLPLKIDERVIGVLNLNNKKTSEPFTPRDYQLASALSEKISHFLKLVHSDTYKVDEFNQFITSFNGLLHAEMKDPGKKDAAPNASGMIRKRRNIREKESQ
jgi:GAF domain-containing protein